MEDAHPSDAAPARTGNAGSRDAAEDAAIAVTRVGPSDAAIAANEASVDAASPHDADVDVVPLEASAAEDAGPADDADAGSEPESGAAVDAATEPLCAGAALTEVEPNDTAATATTFTTSVCGTLAPNGDRDFITITPPNIDFLLEMVGDVALTVSIDGQTVDVPPAVSIPYVAGKPYVIEVRAKHPELGTPTGWRITFIRT